MKIPKPRKLPSGKWFVRCMVDGQSYSKTFDTEKEATRWAAGIKTTLIEAEAPTAALTVEKAVDKYIEINSPVWSPSTTLGYKRIKKNMMERILDIRLADLTQEMIQKWVNSMVKTHSPKSIANAHGLLSAVLRQYKPSMTLRTNLPSKVKAEIQIPSEAEIKAIVRGCKGTKYELPIMLAVWLGLRKSEILGLTWDCIKGDTITIKQAVVMGENGETMKGTKTYSGTRTLHLPAYLKNLIEQQPRTGDRIVTMSGQAIYKGFTRICEKEGLPAFRFHDLRHTNASVMLASGVPDKYSMKRMGHATNNMLKTVYQHTLKEREAVYDQTIDAYFEDMTKPE